MKKWFGAFRLRTLPLAWSCVGVGMSMALLTRTSNWMIAIGCLTTTLLLQVLSNLANDYGDFINGADLTRSNAPKRAVASGAISASSMKIAIVICSILAFMSGIALLVYALKGVINIEFGLWLILGLAAIAAAIKYTSGKNPYGYKGLGDVFVLVFFGPVGVLGTLYLQSHEIAWIQVLPAIGNGLWATAVLNLNNLRDIPGDTQAGKLTIAMRLGLNNAKIYQTFLLITGWLCMMLYIGETMDIRRVYIMGMFGITWILLAYKIGSIQQHAAFDPYLKKTALLTFAWSLVLCTISFV